MRSVRSVWGNSTFLTLLLWILSRTFRSSPYSHRPSGRDRRDRTCDTPLPCCQDSPLSASPGLWCCDASSAKNEEGKYYASMVRKFRTEYKSKNLHGFCKEQKVSYTKMLHCLRNYIKSQLHRDPTNGDIFIIFAS